MSSTATTDATYELIARGRIHESPLNPRRTYDPVKLQELAASIKAKGIISPLLVRPNAKGYEIAAGHRRFRAAATATSGRAVTASTARPGRPSGPRSARWDPQICGGSPSWPTSSATAT